MFQKKKRVQKEVWFFLAPSLIGTGIFVGIPFLDVFRRSFFNVAGSTFTGLKNYRTVLENQAFRMAVKNTVHFLLFCIPLLLISSFVFAIFLDTLGKFGKKLETAFLLPMAVPAASVVIFWRVLFDEKGVINQILKVFRIQGEDWMNTSSAFGILIGSYLWKNLGYDVVFWMAALASIPKEQYEAAKVSGAGFLQCFWYVTIPQMKNGFAVIGILSFVNAFRVFREAYLVSGDYPHQSIYMLQHLFNNWFSKLDIEKMSAAAVLLTLIVGNFLWAVLWKNEKWE